MFGGHTEPDLLPGPCCPARLFAFCLDVEWTEWFRHDKVPHTKGGEKISDLWAAYPGKICVRPLDIQVPTQDSHRVILGNTVAL